MNTKLTQTLGIDYPILQGAMAWISESGLAASVSNAGGAGIIAAANRPPEWVRQEIRKTKNLTDKPFGVNVILMDSHIDQIINVVCQENVAFVTIGAGNSVPFIGQLHRFGIKVIPVVPNVKLAKRVEAAGADAIIIEGMEGGGHIGTLTTMALLTNVIPEVKLPVIAAGGIVDGRGMAAALVMGAAGVQMGSRFLLTEECVLHPRVKERILAANDTDSVVTGYLRGHAVRGIKNKFTIHYLDLESKGVSLKYLDQMATGTLKMAAVDGDIENGSIQVGQSLTLLNRIQSVTEVIREIMDEAINILHAAPTLAT